MEAGNRRADAERVAERIGSRSGGVELAIFAAGSFDAQFGAVRQPASDVLDCAADGVAAIKRALRSAKNLDPLDVVNVEDGALRTVEIDIVEIESDALLKAADRVLAGRRRG